MPPTEVEVAAAEEPAAAAGPPPGMPPANEAGFPMLPMFGSEAGELFNALSTQATTLMINSSPVEGVMSTGMTMLGADHSMAQVGTQLLTSYGALKAELVSNGMLQTSLEGFSPLSILQLNTQLAFMPAGFAGGVLQALAFTPVGMLMGSVNTGGQLSTEFFTGMQPTPTSGGRRTG